MDRTELEAHRDGLKSRLRKAERRRTGHIAISILDRLLHHSHVITIRGESCQLKEKRQAGLLMASKQRDVSTTPSPQRVNS
jgi:hypothetical protein